MSQTCTQKEFDLQNSAYLSVLPSDCSRTMVSDDVILALYPYDQLISGVNTLVELMVQVVTTVRDVYVQVTPDIMQYCRFVPNVERLTPSVLDTIRRVHTNLLNATRFFNPRRFASLELREDLSQTKGLPYSIIVELFAYNARMLEYISDRIVPLLHEFIQLVRRVEAIVPRYDESLWNGMMVLQTRMVALVLDVLNPVLFANLHWWSD